MSDRELVIELLIKSSEFRNHNSNCAKEYVYIHDKKLFLTVGNDCFFKNKILYYIDEKKVIPLDNKERYSLCYGLSLTNIITLLTNKNIHVDNITVNNKGYYIMTYTVDDFNVREYKSLLYNEPINITQFFYTELFTYLAKLYDINIT